MSEKVIHRGKPCCCSCRSPITPQGKANARYWTKDWRELCADCAYNRAPTEEAS